MILLPKQISFFRLETTFSALCKSQKRVIETICSTLRILILHVAASNAKPNIVFRLLGVNHMIEFDDGHGVKHRDPSPFL